MNGSTPKKSLRLIRGGKPKHYWFAGVQLVVATRETLPDDAEIMVFEEDTKMVLTVDKELIYRGEDSIRTLTDIHNAPKHVPGSLVKQGNSWYALVIDLDAECVCQPCWIEEAYTEIFNTIKAKKVAVAGMHLLGSTYGKIPYDQALRMLHGGLKNRSSPPLKKIYLVVDRSAVKETRRQLDTYVYVGR